MTERPPAGLPGGALSRATKADVDELLVLQRCCWVTEAIANDTLDIPALHEDADTVRDWVTRRSAWAVRQHSRLVAAIRAHRDHDRWEIGRLMVAPDLRGRGLGRWLLRHAERQAPHGIRSFELFTGSRSDRNIRMYRAAGYRIAELPPERLDQHIAGAILLTKPRAAAP